MLFLALMKVLYCLHTEFNSPFHIITLSIHSHQLPLKFAPQCIVINCTCSDEPVNVHSLANTQRNNLLKKLVKWYAMWTPQIWFASVNINWIYILILVCFCCCSPSIKFKPCLLMFLALLITFSCENFLFFSFF